MEAPSASVGWNIPAFRRRVTVTLTDTGSGVKRMYYRPSNLTDFKVVEGDSALINVQRQGLTWSFDLVTEDNDGNRSDVITYTTQ